MSFSRGVAVALLAVGAVAMPVQDAAARKIVVPGTAAKVVKREAQGPGTASTRSRTEIPRLSPDPEKLQAVKARADRRAAVSGSLPSTARSLLSPMPRAVVFGGRNSTGMSAGGSETPPDTTGAIGPDNYLEFVNDVGITAYDRNLSPLGTSVRLGSFIQRSSDSVFDPQIQWDDSWGRWIYVMDDVEDSTHNYLAFGWSKTADPTNLTTEQPGGAGTAGWCSYFLATGSEFDDYPKLGHSNEGITIGSNVFDSSTGAFLTARIWSVAKPANPQTCPSGPTAESFGSAATPLTTEDGNEAFTPVPANTADSSPDSYVVAADSFYFTSPDAQIMAWHVTGGGSTASLVADGNIDVGSFSAPADVPQPGTTQLIDSSDTRLTGAVAVTDPAVGEEAVWTQHTIAGAGGRSVVRWYELLPATHTVRQEGTISDPTQFAFNGAISPTRQGDAAMIDFNRGGAALFPDMHAESREATTPLGQMVHDVLLGESSGAAVDFSCGLNGRSCRWGDYAGASPDPSVPGIVWGSSQGLAAPNSSNATWTTRNFAISTDETPPETSLDSGPPGLTNDSAPSFGFSSSETSSTFECKVDLGASSPCTSPFTSAPLADGLHSFSVWATDASGNTDPTPATRTFTVDTTPPDTTITGGPAAGSTVQSVTPSVAFSSSESGSSFACQVDSGGFGPCASPFTTPALGKGPHTVEVQATDAAGNTDPTPASLTFSVETPECVSARAEVAAARTALAKARKRLRKARTHAAKLKARAKLKKAKAKLRQASAHEALYC